MSAPAGRTISPALWLALAGVLATHGLGWVAWTTPHERGYSSGSSTPGTRAPIAMSFDLYTQADMRRPLSEEVQQNAPGSLLPARPAIEVQPRPAEPEGSAWPADFVPSSALDTPVVPMSAPDTSRLDGLRFSGQRILLRLFIDGTGRVQDIHTLQSAPEDAPAIEQIKAMLRDTAYIPGRLQGKQVAVQLDLELQLSSAL